MSVLKVIVACAVGLVINDGIANPQKEIKSDTIVTGSDGMRGDDFESKGMMTQKYFFRRTDLSVAERVEDLIQQMTLEEKIDLFEEYRVEWDGYIDVDRNDSILFFVDAQGGYRLWIDGQGVF